MTKTGAGTLVVDQANTLSGSTTVQGGRLQLANGDGSVTFAFAAAGDTNLDWQVDILDAADFLSTGLFDAGAYNPTATQAGAVAAVPEPTGLAAWAAGMLAAAGWMRRRNRPVSRG